MICSLLSICGKKNFPTIAEIDKKLTNILTKYDLQNLQNISLTEFQSLISKDNDILQLLKGHNFVLSDDLREIMEDEKAIVQCDSDLDEEILLKTKIEKKTKTSIEGLIPGLTSEVIEDRIKLAENFKKEFQNESYRPNFFKSVVEEKRSPDVNIEPTHVFGYRGYDLRNNLKITPTGELIMFSGKTAVVSNKKTSTQKIFQCHSQEISCIASFENYFATGEFGQEPTIHVWDYKTLQVKFSLKGILKQGVSHICFTHDGKKLAALEVGPNHTVVIYDFAKLLAGKANDYKEQVIGMFKGPDKVKSI